jgi:hypothetical protein
MEEFLATPTRPEKASRALSISCSAQSGIFEGSLTSDWETVRQAFLAELTNLFSKLGFPDEWLVSATWLVDRASARPAKQPKSPDFKSKAFWLGAVTSVIKMSRADAHCHLKGMLKPLVRQWMREEEGHEPAGSGSYEESGTSRGIQKGLSKGSWEQAATRRAIQQVGDDRGRGGGVQGRRKSR